MSELANRLLEEGLTIYNSDPNCSVEHVLELCLNKLENNLTHILKLNSEKAPKNKLLIDCISDLPVTYDDIADDAYFIYKDVDDDLFLCQKFFDEEFNILGGTHKYRYRYSDRNESSDSDIVSYHLLTDPVRVFEIFFNGEFY